MILRYSEIGDGDPVVMLHSRPADRTQWPPLAGRFVAAGYRVLCPDLPGFGQSPVHTTGAAARWDDVCETPHELEIDRAFFVGNSFGAQTALQVAATHPDQVSGLCVMGYRRRDQPPTDRLQRAWDEEDLALKRAKSKAPRNPCSPRRLVKASAQCRRHAPLRAQAKADQDCR